VEAIKLFKSTTRDLNVTIDQSMKVSSFFKDIQKWRFQVMGISILLRVQGERWDHTKEDMGTLNLSKKRH
jgi:hypothetical protein